MTSPKGTEIRQKYFGTGGDSTEVIGISSSGAAFEAGGGFGIGGFAPPQRQRCVDRPSRPAGHNRIARQAALCSRPTRSRRASMGSYSGAASGNGAARRRVVFPVGGHLFSFYKRGPS